MIHILIKRVHVGFHRGNLMFKPIIIVNHIFLRDLGQLWTEHKKIRQYDLDLQKTSSYRISSRYRCFEVIYKRKCEFLKETLYEDYGQI